MLRRSAWGEGFATEAAEAGLQFVFEDLGWPSVAHMIHPENVGSQAVARRIGSRFLKTVSLPPPMDVAGPTQMWGQTAQAWRARARA